MEAKNKSSAEKKDAKFIAKTSNVTASKKAVNSKTQKTQQKQLVWTSASSKAGQVLSVKEANRLSVPVFTLISRGLLEYKD